MNNAGGLEVGPGLNGSTTHHMTLRDGEHRPLAAQFMSHSLQPTPPQKQPTPRTSPASRVLISSTTEMAVSPGPAAYRASAAYTTLHSPRSFARTSVAFGAKGLQRPPRPGSHSLVAEVPTAVVTRKQELATGAWGHGLGVFEETSWTNHTALVSYSPRAGGVHV